MRRRRRRRQLSYDDRAKWAEERLPRVVLAAGEPLHPEHRKFWLEAEEPWQVRAAGELTCRCQ